MRNSHPPGPLSGWLGGIPIYTLSRGAVTTIQFPSSSAVASRSLRTLTVAVDSRRETV